MSQCPNCGQQIPENELTEHIRIELLDPKWKEQKRVLEMRKAQSLQMQQGTDVSASLRNLASARTDLFGDDIDEAERKRREAEERTKRKEREIIIWDGHTNSAQKTENTFQQNFTLDDQIKKMHSRMGLTGEQISNVGPRVPGDPSFNPPTAPREMAPSLPDRSALPPALAASLPKVGGGEAYAGATISAEPTGPTTKEYYEPVESSSSFPASSGPAIHPSRLAAMQSGPPPPSQTVGQTRPYEEDGEAAGATSIFKRPRIEKLPYGQFYSEIDWMSLHPDPISLSIQLPSMPEKPEWKLNGSIITVPDLPVNTLFSTLRERIARVIDADLPLSRLKLDYNGKTMNNKNTLASVNLDETDVVVMSIRK